jgi:hypothetical protein
MLRRPTVLASAGIARDVVRRASAGPRVPESWKDKDNRSQFFSWEGMRGMQVAEIATATRIVSGNSPFEEEKSVRFHAKIVTICGRVNRTASYPA